MAVFAPPSSFAALLESTKADRALVRSHLATGQWQACEPVASRLKQYEAKLRSALPPGAEALQGDTTDYQSASFLATGAQARRAVAYVEINLLGKWVQATGFLISKGLFITNNHVIRTADEALAATIFFDRELDANRSPSPATSFRLDPTLFFATSSPDALDFTVVAIGERVSGPGSLDEFGYCSLSPLGDKHILGMNINIVQHPNGQYKQVAIRNNLLTYRTEHTLLYETDTEVGSSGSPVFNDFWELVALHHWGAPFVASADVSVAPGAAPDQAALPANANEGLRASAIHAALSSMLPTLDRDRQQLLADALDGYKTASGPGSSTAKGRLTPPHAAQPAAESLSTPIKGSSAMQTTDSQGTVTLTVPLQISIRLGAPNGLDLALPAQAPNAVPAVPRLSRAAEAVRVDVDYGNRSGYKSDFLDGPAIPLPVLSPELAKQVAPLRAGEQPRQPGLLDYEHFSLVMHKTHRVAIYTATNIDGDTYKRVDRKTGKITSAEAEGDTWYKDPRVSESFWLGQDFYSTCSDYFDKGHLTRRTDPTWGSAEEAVRANTDTFHFTNCSPQHFRFNEASEYWQGVERYVLETGLLQATGKAARLCVMQGPIYNNSIDLWIDNEVQIPSSFWKVVIWKGSNGLKAVGLVVDQLQLLSETRIYMGKPKDIPSVNVSQWRVHIADIAKRTGLTFDDVIVNADTIGQPKQPQPGAEAARGIRVNQLSDIAL